MRKILLLLLVSIYTVNTNAESYITLKVGETYSVSRYDNPQVIGEAISASIYSSGARIIAVTPGFGSFTSYSISYTYGSPNSSYSTQVFHVLDVIPSDINMIVGESHTYSPVVDSSNSEYNSFTWTSNNTAVATVDANGNVNAVAPGRATITCTANGGNSFSSVVYVSTQLAQAVTLNKKSYEMSVGGTYTLTATVAPTNATQKTVNWLSSNENVAQVSDAGKVTAIAPGYCSIYAKADDGSGKFAKCLIHVTGTAGSRSDVNGDGVVTVTDAEVVIEEILSQP